MSRSSKRDRLQVVLACVLACVAHAAAAKALGFDEALAELERRPEELRAGNELRRLCREQGRVERCIEVFDELARRRPELNSVRYQAALAYVDALPGLSLLRQGSLSTHSIAHVTSVLQRSPDDWLALYIRGLNNLYWPSWFGRTRRALADLRRCVELSERADPAAAHHALSYAALGDAYVKSGDTARGLQTWARGLQRFPASPELRARAALSRDTAAAFVDSQRDLDRPIDTDLSFLWRRS